MLATKFATLCRISNRTTGILCSNEFHASASRYVDQEWRRQNKLPQNPTTYGPLTNDPDYTFKDGRCTPYGARHMQRINRQREYAERIALLVGQVDHAVEKHARLQDEAKVKRQQTIDKKLKPKGKLYKPLIEN